MDIPGNKAKFGRYILAFLLSLAVSLGLVWWWVIAEPMAYQERDYPIWLAKMKMVDQGQVGTLTIVGDSTPTADLIPARLGPGVVNLGLSGGSTIDTFYMAQKVVAAPTPPKAVILSISPYGFTRADFLWFFSIGYSFLDPEQTEEVRHLARTMHDEHLFGVESPGDLDTRLKIFLYQVRFPSSYFPALMNSHFYRRYDINRKSFDLVMADRGQSYFELADGTTKPDHEVGLKSFVPNQVLDDYFDRTLALFQSRHIPVYYIAMPHNSASVRRYAPGLKGEFVIYLNQYAAKYPGFRILGDPLPSYPSKYYGDPWHLNQKGAVMWSDYVRQLLNDSHVEGGPFVVN